MQKGIEPTEEEVKGKKLALTPLTALPEELILFQRVLQLFRGVRTSVFVRRKKTWRPGDETRSTS